MSLLNKLKGVSEQDQRMIQETESMFGPEPEEMGFIKNLYWGRIREELVFPYPEETPEKKEKTDRLIEELDAYLRSEHPTIEIDQTQEIPDWVVRRLFELGVLGMIIPEEYGGLGLGVTAYNRVLERIGATCGSTGVMVSAHQSIGCKALVLFGTERQKKEFLPMVASEKLSAFCLSEPQVGSDAAGQETSCVYDEKEDVYIINGEKKWSTSAATSGLFTVMANQEVTDPKTGKKKKGVTALIVTPDMEGVDVFEKNRSKTGIRGTWQGRVRLTNVRVPGWMRLHHEGQGLKVALSCLNYGRCTLSAGVTGAAKQAVEQATKWVRTRHQFGRPLSEFELVQEHVARMAARTYAMDAVLYMSCGMLDRGEKDIMVETAACKVFCSEQGWNVIDDGMQIMGGEGYMTENEYERGWRDNRIHRIVEGSNEVMQSFIFAYGGKQLAEYMLGVLNAVDWDEEESAWNNLTRIASTAVKPDMMKAGAPLASEIFLGIKKRRPDVERIHPLLKEQANLLGEHVQQHTRHFKLASKRLAEQIVTAQNTQARLADNAILMYAWVSTLSKLDMQLRRGDYGPAFERDKAAAIHFMRMADLDIRRNVRALTENADRTMRAAAVAQYAYNDTLPNEEYYIHESSPTARGTGKPIDTNAILQFPGEKYAGKARDVIEDSSSSAEPTGDGAPAVERPSDEG